MTGEQMIGKHPLISVIIPVFNMERYLPEAIDSVLRQTCRPDEIIVVDDGSTDGSSATAARYAPDVTLISQENSGLGAARNYGLRNSHGDFLAFLDADDLWDERKLERQTAILDSDRGIEAVFVLAKQFFTPGIDPAVVRSIRFAPDGLPLYTAPAMLIRRESFFRVGYYKTGLQVGTDMEWRLRSREAGLITAVVEECLYFRRLHGGNQGIVNRHHFPQRLRLLKEALDRRKSSVGVAKNSPTEPHE